MNMELRFTNQESSIPLRVSLDNKNKEEFWNNFERTFNKITIKPMDLNFIRIYLTDKEFPQVSLNNTQEVDSIMGEFYQCNLKHNANRNFLKWIKKYNDNLDKLYEKLEDERENIEIDYENYDDQHPDEDDYELNMGKQKKEIELAEKNAQVREIAIKMETIKSMIASNTNKNNLSRT